MGSLVTGEENLLLMADLHHLGRAERRRRAAGLLDQFDLADAARKTAATYSGGMRRRLDLAMTLIGDPRIIFLDEPTTGLGPRSRRMMWQIIRELVAGGVTIFLTTQDTVSSPCGLPCRAAQAACGSSSAHSGKRDGPTSSCRAGDTVATTARRLPGEPTSSAQTARAAAPQPARRRSRRRRRRPQHRKRTHAT
jgi:ABC-2 type transport system ATP-binding protein